MKWDAPAVSAAQVHDRIGSRRLERAADERRELRRREREVEAPARRRRHRGDVHSAAREVVAVARP